MILDRIIQFLKLGLQLEIASLFIEYLSVTLFMKVLFFHFHGDVQSLNTQILRLEIEKKILTFCTLREMNWNRISLYSYIGYLLENQVIRGTFETLKDR